MRTDRSVKNALNFDKLKNQKFSLEIDIKVNEEWLIEHPRSIDSLREVAEARETIAEIDALLAKEPPAPELPPRQPLIKVSGVLEEIETLFARGYFTDREYEPEEFARRENSRQWGSVLLAAIGESAASAVNSQDEVRQSDVYDFVKGKINGKPFHGWLGRTTAKPGDYIELAAVEKDDCYEVYALAIPDLKIISILPRCYRAKYPKARDEVWGCLIFPIVMATIIAIIGAFASDFNFDLQYFEMIGYMVAVSATYGIIALPFTYRSILKKPNPTNLMAQNIFSILRMKDPERIDLEKKTKNALCSLSSEKTEGRIMPDKNCWVEYYFYY